MPRSLESFAARPTRLGGGENRIGVAAAVLTWAGAWLVGGLVAAAVVSVSGYSTTDTADRPLWVTVVSLIGLWGPLIIGLALLSAQLGSGSWAVDYGARFKPVDLVGVPLGVLTQLVLLRLVYWPLVEWWPDTFSQDRLEENARDLYDRADGVWIVALVLVIALGAPVVEELVYRGLLQGSLRRRVADGLAMVLVAMLFALIHLRPVEYPGLFAFALVVGACRMMTRRLGMSIAAHIAFNSTGLLIVALR